jgi:hypothetical protein
MFVFARKSVMRLHFIFHLRMMVKNKNKENESKHKERMLALK